MQKSAHLLPSWLSSWMKSARIRIWGIADLREFAAPEDDSGRGFPFALSWAIPMNPEIMFDIQDGPNQAYADDYARVNTVINTLAEKLTAEISARGFQARFLAASARTDMTNLKGDFPHKTAATRAGIGWIGRHCQLVVPTFGPWIRLGTVFTDMDLPCGEPAGKSFCGRCTRCVDACPAGALRGADWYPGRLREDILDVHACDRWKKENYFRYHQGHNCGICSAVCPYGVKSLRKTS